MKKLIVGNWKMNPKTVKEAETLFKGVSAITKTIKNVDVVVCPPFLFLAPLKKLNNKKIALGGQNIFSEQDGAYTGEVSALMLADARASYVIIGHSERRSRGETDELIAKKLVLALRAKLTPIVCVGETARSSDGEYLHTVKDQITRALTGISKNYTKQIVIAYEPVWALSTTENRHDATPHDFEEMRIYIRKVLADMYSPQIAKDMRILYGGSVSKDTAGSFLEASADGLLVGKASLDPKNFGAIIQVASSIK